MTSAVRQAFAKVPEVTFTFWIIKIAATTLGQTGGDAVTMSMGLGHALGTEIVAAICIAAVASQIRADKLHPPLYWFVIVVTTTVGTTLADLLDRSLGIAYAGAVDPVARAAGHAMAVAAHARIGCGGIGAFAPG